MKDTISDFIATTLGKLDTSAVIMLLPVAVCVYLLFFVPNEDIESVFGIKQQSVEIVCPSCGDTLVINKTFLEINQINKSDETDDNM